MVTMPKSPRREMRLTPVEDEAVDADARVVLDADALETARHIGKRGERRDQPAVAEAPLLDVVATGILEEGWLLKDLGNALHGLGNGGARVGNRLPPDVPLGGAEAVEAVSLLPLEIPVLQHVCVSDWGTTLGLMARTRSQPGSL